MIFQLLSLNNKNAYRLIFMLTESVKCYFKSNCFSKTYVWFSSGHSSSGGFDIKKRVMSVDMEMYYRLPACLG